MQSIIIIAKIIAVNLNSKHALSFSIPLYKFLIWKQFLGSVWLIEVIYQYA